MLHEKVLMRRQSRIDDVITSFDVNIQTAQVETPQAVTMETTR